MLNMDRARISMPRNLSASRVNSYSKVNTNRQTRHEARERRRRGDWDILEIPISLLWLDEVCAAAAFDVEAGVECADAAIIGLWP